MAIFTNSPVCGAHPSRFCRSTILSHFLPRISLIVSYCIHSCHFYRNPWVKYGSHSSNHITTSPSPSYPIAQWHRMRRMGPHDLSPACLEDVGFSIALYPLVMTNVAIENGPVEIVDFPIENGGSFHTSSYVKLPEGNWFEICFKSFCWGKCRFRLVFIYVFMSP